MSKYYRRCKCGKVTRTLVGAAKHLFKEHGEEKLGCS